MKPFQRIVLYARQHRATSGVYETLKRLKAHWQKRKTLEIFLESETAHYFSDLDLPVADLDGSDAGYDLLVVVGGDGSLLSAAKLAVTKNIPVVGINRGRLGFLTPIVPDEAEKKLDEILEGNYKEERRFLLQAQIWDDGLKQYESLALNDIVLMPGEEPYMIEFEVFEQKTLISGYRADGLIVATPTGSTAYALSGGGPILQPHLEAIALVPMFPHTLSSRPIVLSTKNAIEIRLLASNEFSAHLSCDGQERQIVAPGQWVHIEKFPETLCLLQPVEYSYYETLRSKLGWETSSC